MAAQLSSQAINLPYTVFAALLLIVFFSCSSQPAKYRHSNDCKCPKWNYVPKAPFNSEHANGQPAPAPYFSGRAKRS